MSGTVHFHRNLLVLPIQQRSAAPQPKLFHTLSRPLFSGVWQERLIHPIIHSFHMWSCLPEYLVIQRLFLHFDDAEVGLGSDDHRLDDVLL